MKVARRQIASAISELSLKTKPDKLANEVAAYLLSEGRSNELDSLMRDVIEDRSEHGVVEVSAVSAHELDQKSITDIKHEVKTHYPNAREIIVSPKLDKSIIGGVRLELTNARLDLSLVSKLNRFKQLMTYGKDL
ncbi:MAG: F0F1 ATP synthase subunit delta [Candidatus Saccharimonadales bacterium]